MASAASLLEPLVRRLMGDDPPVAVRFWDGSALGGDAGTTIVVRSPEAVRHLVWSPDSVGLGRAYESRWDDAVHLAGEGRAKVWRLYMAASALNFEAGRTGIHQVLAVRSEGGHAGMPRTRDTYA